MPSSVMFGIGRTYDSSIGEVEFRGATEQNVVGKTEKAPPASDRSFSMQVKPTLQYLSRRVQHQISGRNPCPELTRHGFGIWTIAVASPLGFCKLEAAIAAEALAR